MPSFCNDKISYSSYYADFLICKSLVQLAKRILMAKLGITLFLTNEHFYKIWKKLFSLITIILYYTTYIYLNIVFLCSKIVYKLIMYSTDP